MTDPSAPAPFDRFYPVVPAGGAGTRLWPLSRAAAPKFFQDLTGQGRSLIQATFDRLQPMAADGIVVVTGRAHVAELCRQLPQLHDEDIIAEPSPRDSMAAIGLAAAVLQQRHGPLVIGSFAADHVIRGEEKFRAAVAEAIERAREGWVATIGMPAATASSAYGYIELGEAIDGGPSHVVATFTEKPSAEVAAQYVATGRYRWNAGMFVVASDVLLGHLARLRPALHEGLSRIAAAWDTPERMSVLESQWPRLERVAIDYAIAEPVAAEGGVAVVSGRFGWDDVGDWQSVADLLAPRSGGERVLGAGEVLTRDADGALVVPQPGKQVCVLGAADLVVVDTPDALLVAHRSRAQEVKAMVEALRAAGRQDVL